MTSQQRADRAGGRSLAGHPVLRLLAVGERSRVWVAAGDLVLKELQAPCAVDQPQGETEALHRARGEHVVELLDVSVDDAGVVLVFPRLPRGSLAEVLSGRAGLDAGEAVTVLAPIASTLARMHAAGVAHAALSPANILFRADAAPMLCGFGHATLFEAGLPEVQREKEAGVVADRAALAALAVEVLGRVTGPRAAAAAAVAATLGPGSSQLDLESRLGRQLFELAAARPVVTDLVDEAEAPVRAVGVVTVGEPAPPEAAPDSSLSLGGLIAGALESGPGARVRGRVRELWAGWSPARRKAVLAAAAAVVVVVVAVVAIPSPGMDGGPAAAKPPDVAAAPAEPAEPATAVTADDPLAALTALLDRREDCFRDLSVLCLDDVAEQGSAALESDRAALDAVLDAGDQPPPISGAGASLVERLGDSALIALAPDSDPASVLLLKGEAGWRIRDYLAG